MSDEQQPDTAPGAYYVTACDVISNAGHIAGVYRMLGPFVDDHAGALACVEAVRLMALELDGSGRAQFMSWGTVRYPTGTDFQGTMNKYFF